MWDCLPHSLCLLSLVVIFEVTSLSVTSVRVFTNYKSRSFPLFPSEGGKTVLVFLLLSVSFSVWGCGPSNCRALAAKKRQQGQVKAQLHFRTTMFRSNADNYKTADVVLVIMMRKVLQSSKNKSKRAVSPHCSSKMTLGTAESLQCRAVSSAYTVLWIGAVNFWHCKRCKKIFSSENWKCICKVWKDPVGCSLQLCFSLSYRL